MPKNAFSHSFAGFGSCSSCRGSLGCFQCVPDVFTQFTANVWPYKARDHRRTGRSHFPHTITRGHLRQRPARVNWSYVWPPSGIRGMETIKCVSVLLLMTTPGWVPSKSLGHQFQNVDNINKWQPLKVDNIFKFCVPPTLKSKSFYMSLITSEAIEQQRSWKIRILQSVATNTVTM